MDELLKDDKQSIAAILAEVGRNATEFFDRIDALPVAKIPKRKEIARLSERGVGALRALRLFNQKYRDGIIASAGPRFFGFVIGGTTPAALVGDWLASAYDMPTIGSQDSSAPQIERETISQLRELFGLSGAHFGSFVTGATMSNFVGLALGRQWVARELGINVAEKGLYQLPPIAVLSGSPHSCIYKAMSMLGMGKTNLRSVPVMEGREAVDIAALRAELARQPQPSIVLANAGTVNTCDFDDLQAILALKREFKFWLHVDAAFGAFAACSPRYEHLIAGLDDADSITVDAHKWLNVPYDSAMQFTRHKSLQIEIFQNSGAYLAPLTDEPDFVHVTPENSRRLRALSAWFTLQAYGKSGYRDIVERNCDMAALLSRRIETSKHFRLLAPTRLNTVCFTIGRDSGAPTNELVKQFLGMLADTGEVFMTPTVYKGAPGIRAAICNWRTEAHDIDIAWEALERCAIELL